MRGGELAAEDRDSLDRRTYHSDIPVRTENQLLGAVRAFYIEAPDRDVARLIRHAGSITWAWKA